MLWEVHLYDSNNEVIRKETPSKGEQQIYATAILKSLIDETEINFPIFVDSPFQKFDSIHSDNIITNFYQDLSEQVVLLPLLDKEMNSKEFATIIPYVRDTYILHNMNQQTTIDPIVKEELLKQLSFNKTNV